MSKYTVAPVCPRCHRTPVVYELPGYGFSITCFLGCLGEGGDDAADSKVAFYKTFDAAVEAFLKSKTED